MNKKLFIFIFLIMASPVYAGDTAYPDVAADEIEPSLEIVNNEAQTGKTHFTQKVKNIFTRQNNDLGEEVSAESPDKETQKKLDKLEKQHAKEVKEYEKQQKKAEKAAEKAAKKTSKNTVPVNDEAGQTAEGETPAVNTSSSTTVLTDTAYQGSITTNKIIEVNDCVKLALENHPSIQVAMSDAEIYKSKIAQAWANYFPTFSAGVSYSRNNMQISNFSPPVQEYDMFYVPNISGNMLLFDFGKTKAQADIAKRTYESSQLTLQNTINTVIYNVKQSYYNLLFAQQQVQVYEDTVKDYTLHLEQAKAYYNIGSKAKIDVLTAEYNLGNAKLKLIQAKNTLKIAYVQLSNAMGMPDYTDYDVTDNLTTKAYDIKSDDAVKTAFETSPELLASKKKADASELLVRASKRAFTPDISGFASYTRGGKKVDTDYGYQAGVQLNYNTVNLLLLKKQVDEAKATYKRDLADYENTKQTIYFDVKQAYINLTNAQDSIGVAKLSMDQAKEQYDQASGRYKVGLGDAIELKDAETTYRNSQLEYYNTLLNYHVSAANLEKLMGAPLESSDNDLL